jgi:2-polyprenyl-3-methyl-5-hydroxy-6-metoxy-1,4-benzoquinol methylase
MSLSDWHQEQRKHFDEKAAEYEELYEHDTPYFDFVLEHFLAAIPAKPGTRVLELGAAGGRFTLPMLSAGCKVTATDLAPKSLAYMEKKAADHPQRANLRLIEDDASTLANVPERDFDAVVGGHFLHHVEDQGVVLRKAREALRPGGRAVFVEPNPWSVQQYVANTVLPGISWRTEKGLLKMWPGRIQRIFVESGFSSCRVVPFGVFPPLFLNRLNLGGWARAFEAAAEKLGRPSALYTLNLFVGETA